MCHLNRLSVHWHQARSRCRAAAPTTRLQNFPSPRLRLRPQEARTPRLLPHPWLPPPALCLCGRDASRSGVTRDVSFCAWLLPPRTVTSGSVHAVAGGRTSSLPGAGSHSGVWMDHTVCTDLSTRGPLGHSHFGAAVNTGVQTALGDFQFFGSVLRSGTVGSHGNSA